MPGSLSHCVLSGTGGYHWLSVLPFERCVQFLTVVLTTVSLVASDVDHLSTCVFAK